MELEVTCQPAPLAGLKVVDLSRVLAGPYAAMLLGDLGADVIKIERPGAGDDTRSWGPPFVGAQGQSESTYYLSANRNKRSVALDLKDPADREILVSLLEDADVLLENFRLGVMERLGLSPEWLQERNPRLIVASITGFGQDGPQASRVGYDQILQAEGGLMSLTGDRPTRVGVPIADLAAGLFAVIGILSALVEREHSGRGQRVHTSLLSSQIGIHTFQATRYLVAGEVPGPSGNRHPTVAPYGLFPTADTPIVLAVGNDEIWRRFAPLIGLDPTDPQFVDNSRRLANRDLLEGLISGRLAEAAAADWLARFASADVPAGEVKTLDRVYADEQVLSEGLVMEVDHPSLGRIELPGFPIRFSRSHLPSPIHPPLLDEHGPDLRRDAGGTAWKR